MISFQLLQSLLHDENISETPVVVLANKTDRKDAVGEEMVVNSLGLSIYRTGRVSGNLQINSLTSFSPLNKKQNNLGLSQRNIAIAFPYMSTQCLGNLLVVFRL